MNERQMIYLYMYGTTNQLETVKRLANLALEQDNPVKQKDLIGLIHWVEIKSPTEEMHISVKAIRQALENKIILLSRKTYITTNKCSTYAVGYFPPNDR